MSKLANVKYGTAQLPSGKKIEVGFRQWYEWLEHPETKSFRVDDGEGYTARKETAKGYWYAYRKVEGKLHKRYIGLSKALTLRRLAEVGELFDIPCQPKLPKPMGNSKVSEELHNELGNLRAENEALKARLGASDHCEATLKERTQQLEKELAEVRSQSDKLKEKREKWINELLEENSRLAHRVRELEGTGVLLRIEEKKNKELEQERKELREQLNGLLELQTSQAQELREVRTQLSKQPDPAYDKDVIALRKQLTAEIERFKETENSLRGNDVSWQMRLTEAKNELGDANAKLLRQYDTNRKLEREVSQLREQLSSQTAPQLSEILEFPDAATLLNKLKTRRKKSKIDLQDVEAFLELLPEMPAQQSQPQLPDLFAAREKLFEMPSVGGWKFDSGEKRDRFYAFASALIEEASKLNPNYTIIQRLQSDLKQATERCDGYSNQLREKTETIRKLTAKLG